MKNLKNKKIFDQNNIPNNWEMFDLDKIGEFKNGINKDKEEFGHGFPFINLMDVFNRPKVYNGKFSLVNSTDAERRDFNLKKGDVLFVRSSVKPEGVGLTTLVCQDMPETTFSGFLIRFREIGKLDFEYKAHCFFEVNFRNNLLKHSTVSANTNINQDTLKKLKILVPPLPEQKAIASVLGLMDIAINKNNQLINQKELLKKWLMQNLLTGKKRLKGFKGKWKEYHLGEMFLERNETNNNGLTLLSIGQNGVYPQSESDKKDTSNGDKSKYKRICPGDIGYNTMRMWQGRSALSCLEGIVSPAYTIVTPKQKSDSLFFSYLFKTPKLINLFWRNSQGLVDDTLNCKYKDFSIVKIQIPEKEEQSAIAQVLQLADKEIQLLKSKTEKLKEQKKWLMQVLLTGKKRLKGII